MVSFSRKWPVFCLILVEAGSFLLHEIVEGLEFIHCFRRLAGEFFADLLAGCFQFVFPGSQFSQGISFYGPHGQEKVRKNGQDSSAGRTVHSSHPGFRRCRRRQYPRPLPEGAQGSSTARAYFLSSAADIIYFGLYVQAVEHLFQFSGHGFDFLPVRPSDSSCFGRARSSESFSTSGSRCSQKWSFIVPDVQATGKAASFFPVHAGAGFVQT